MRSVTLVTKIKIMLNVDSYNVDGGQLEKVIILLGKFYLEICILQICFIMLKIRSFSHKDTTILHQLKLHDRI